MKIIISQITPDIAEIEASYIQSPQNYSLNTLMIFEDFDYNIQFEVGEENVLFVLSDKFKKLLQNKEFDLTEVQWIVLDQHVSKVDVDYWTTASVVHFVFDQEKKFIGMAPGQFMTVSDFINHQISVPNNRYDTLITLDI